MRRFHYALAAGAALFAGTSAQASITLSAVPGSNPYTGPVPTYNFESPAPVTNGLVTNTSVGGVSAQPFGSTGYFWTVGPTDGSPGILDLSSFGDIDFISFIWGSVDTYNTLEALDAADTVLGIFTGIDAYAFADGNQTNPFTNPLVTLLFTGSDTSAAAKLRLTSSSNAFETDNFFIATRNREVDPVPEPGTWALMLLGFGALGMTLRRRRRTLTALAQAV